MKHWDSIDGVREPPVPLSLEERKSERALALQKAIEDIKVARRKTLPELMAYLDRRTIEHFVHFTRFENLEGILKSGLIPPTALETLALPTPWIRTDKGRWDGIPEASCLSVTNPNHFMFEAKRGDGKGWVVLGFSAAKVLQLPSIFVPHNAATGGRRERIGASLKHLPNKATPKAFEKMFPEESVRNSLGIQLNETENCQAEVMVLDTIPPDMLAFLAPYRTPLAELEPLLLLCPSHLELLVEKSDRRTRLVSGRVDDPFWRSSNHGHTT